VRLRNRTVYADYDKFYQNVFAGGAVDPDSGLVALSAYSNQQLRENFFNQTDLTFSSETGAIGHEFLVGMELGEQTTDNLRMTGYFNGTVAENILKLTGTRKPEELKSGEVSHRLERVSGEFTRNFRLPYAVDSGKVDASCEKGILKVRLPRAEADKPKKIAIKSQK